MRRSVLYAFAASYLVASAAAARTRTATLAGTVLDTDGKPAAGATVTAQRSDGTTPLGTHTNSQGRFFFPLLRAGYYDVRAARGKTVSEWRHNIGVRAGKQTEVTLHLARLGAPKKIPASVSQN
jgi:5-hydroxyisourate hydrolase-like protein (transthyretin family)